MTVYHINRGIGWASSGVEYSQLYRSRLFHELHIDQRFVFVDLILNENIVHFTEKMGFRTDDVIWMYLYFTDIPLSRTTVTLDDIRKQIKQTIEREVQDDNNPAIMRLYYDQGRQYATCYLTSSGEETVNRVEFVIDDQLVRKDFYMSMRYMSEYYAPIDGQAKLFLRRFFNQDGTVAYEDHIDGDNHCYRFADHICYHEEQLIDYFMKCLHFNKGDMILIDRATGTCEAVLRHKGESRVGVVVHAEHYSEHITDDDYILWNNFYDYQFMHHDVIEFYITSTEQQKQMLAKQFAHYYHVHPKIYAIPVGSIDRLRYPQTTRQAYHVLTASRLAGEKHIDWLIRAVAQAKQTVPELIFHIYGEGGTRQKLEALIKELQASNYIQLKGHQHLDDVYANYELYLTASTSEGFGLTLLEAIGSGLGMVGLDVPYGNPTFIADMKNGRLVPYDRMADTETTIDHLAEAIVKVLTSDLRQEMAEVSYHIASDYTKENIKEKWLQLMKEGEDA